jgi:hypothetical protein
MLDEIMLRNDLSGTELRIVYYLARTRTNSETGLCFATDQNIADALSVTKRAVEKCKQSLKEKKILDWNTEKLNRKNSVSLYRFIYRERPNARSVENGTPVRYKEPVIPNTGSVSSPNSRSVSEPNKNSVSRHYAKDGSPELAAWDRWSKIKTGRSLPRDRAGGWYVDQQWPPRRELTVAEIFDL